MWRPSICAALLVLVALALHQSLCEWRRFEYLEADSGKFRPRLLVAIDEEVVRGGNAVFWDGEYERFLRYDTLWFECFASSHPDWASDPATLDCFGRQDFPTEASALKAIALVRCETERLGRVRGRAKIELCTAARGATDTHLPRFTSEIAGPRFDATYVRTWGLWAEETSASRRMVWVAGVAFPALLGLVALVVAFRVFARRRHPW